MKKLFTLSLLAFMATIAYAQQPNIAAIEEAKRLKVLDMLQAKLGGTGTNDVTSLIPEQDCMGAIVVCQPIYFQPNSYVGSGDISNEIGAGSCLGAGELNAAWYKIMIVNDGDLAFNITPNDLNNDYDWAVFNLTNANCGDLGTNAAGLQVSCDFSGSTFPTGVTGANGGSNSQDEPVIPVHSGEVYYIVVSNFSNSQSGYTLDFSPSTIELGNCSFIYGSVYLDNNTNCDLDPNDNGLPQQVVYALPGPYYSLSDANGLYRIGIPSGQIGTYQLFTQPLSPALVQECPTNPSFLTVNVTNTDSLYPGNNFAYIPDPVVANPCPALTVSNASSGMYLVCCGGSRTVRVCNNGSATATNVMLDLEYMDNIITLSGATYQYSNTPVPFIQVGNHFYFDLPDLTVGECVTLNIVEQLLDSAATGETSCVMAHVTPDAPCGPPTTGWDGSNIRLNSQCSNNNTVVFTLQNVGVSNMASPLAYTVYQGANVIDNGTYQLASGQSTTRSYPADGDFFVMQAQQSPGNPYGIQPAGFVDSCGDSTFVQTVGFNNFAQGDQPDPFDMDCVTILNSYDPNDKQAVPSGLGPQHFISSNDNIEYKIRFQNTGNGPAQKVVLVDTLDAHLEILTLQIGASNYDYTAELVGNGVLVFTFDNINLPPASTDSLGSIGFITYSISQRWDNPLNYTINNTAYIYFDLNPAIVTNTVFHNVKDNFATSVAETIGKNTLGVILYPNPTNSNITIALSSLKAGQQYSLAIYNSAGMLVKEQTGLKEAQTMLDVATLSSGLYTYRVVTTDGKSAAGRFVKE